ncbi:hypothetical protein ETD83_25260 [Actinomadura soli]|uniref:Uncharacterized protein n=1 Tax=Actinomadura soli TaxID=2508997 RepID=A0A5C4J6H0_9ACTN|nr:hypothetical protein [Actinomadura soli]TMQ93546.1 hypothetical protein ETD83_25260 [Actinomadura soli]
MLAGAHVLQRFRRGRQPVGEFGQVGAQGAADGAEPGDPLTGQMAQQLEHGPVRERLAERMAVAGQDPAPARRRMPERLVG